MTSNHLHKKHWSKTYIYTQTDHQLQSNAIFMV